MNINTLVTDIYKLIETKHEGWFTDELARSLSDSLAKRLQQQLGEDTQRGGTLRLSQMGPRCPRELWYAVNRPECREALPAWAEIKYSYGHVLEEMVITLAKAAGHEVTGEQDALVLDSIVGHRDCVIDGCVVDVKSASSRSFNKFKFRELENQDSFGYLDQLDGYVLASRSDPLVRSHDVGYLLAVDKTLGHLCLYEHKVTHERENALRSRIDKYKRIVEARDPPPCECGVIPHGASGNMQLDLKASYSLFKFCCHPELRTFAYSNGLVYLTKVVRKPDVPEIDRYGNKINPYEHYYGLDKPID